MTNSSNPVTPPSFGQPLITEPAQLNPVANDGTNLGPFEYLVGTWTNEDLGGAQAGGGRDNPFSYNVMVLPQKQGSPHGYILKNFKYYEEMTVSADALWRCLAQQTRSFFLAPARLRRRTDQPGGMEVVLQGYRQGEMSHYGYLVAD